MFTLLIWFAVEVAAVIKNVWWEIDRASLNRMIFNRKHATAYFLEKFEKLVWKWTWEEVFFSIYSSQANLMKEFDEEEIHKTRK